MGVSDEYDGDQDINKDAADVALEWVKQVITLSSGIVALSATFLNKLGSYPNCILFFLIFSWVCFITSILTGLELFSTIVQSHLKKNNNWSEGIGLAYARACKYLFISGVIIFCLFALLSVLF